MLALSSIASDALSSSAGFGNKIREGFVLLAETLLKSVCEVFPECDGSATTLKIFQRIVKGSPEQEETFIKTCAKLFREHSEALRTRDPEGLFSLCEASALLRELRLREKWEDPDFSEESRKNLWDYLLALQTYAKLYDSVPLAVQGRIESMAGAMSEQLRSGKLDLRSLDVASLGKDLVSSLSPQDVQQFEGNLPQIFSCISEVAAAVSKKAGGQGFDPAVLVEQVARLQAASAGDPSGAVGVSVETLLRELGGTLAPGLLSSSADVQRLLQMAGGLITPPAAASAGRSAAPQKRRKTVVTTTTTQS